MSKVSDFLKSQKVDTSKRQDTMPADIVVFDAGSLIFPAYAMMAYHIMSPDPWSDHLDVTEENGNPVVTQPTLSQQRGDWYNYWYLNYEAAVNALSILNPPDPDKNFKPELQFVIYGASSTVMNVKDLEKFVTAFGDQIVFSVPVQTLADGSKQYPRKKRHQYSLMALPSIVAAVATVSGVENAGFDLTELTKARGDDEFTDEFYHLMVGDPEASYKDSFFFDLRTKLWESLGESNPRAQYAKGTKTSGGNPNSLTTVSEMLSDCFDFVQSQWENPVYIRLTNAKDPFPESKSDGGRRWTVPCVTEVFPDESTAATAAATDLAEDGEPTLPEEWVKYRAEWIKQVQEYSGPANEKIVREKLAASLDDYLAWKEFLGK